MPVADIIVMLDKICLASIPGEEERVLDGWGVDESR
jgi:hypothetical protein